MEQLIRLDTFISCSRDPVSSGCSVQLQLRKIQQHYAHLVSVGIGLVTAGVVMRSRNNRMASLVSIFTLLFPAFPPSYYATCRHIALYMRGQTKTPRYKAVNSSLHGRPHYSGSDEHKRRPDSTGYVSQLHTAVRMHSQ